MNSIEEKIKYLDDLLDDSSNVIGEIYMIINLINNKMYIGQTVSHRKNRNKYRPFGCIRRFNDHVSEATVQKKPAQCTYLNNAIRKYTANYFTVELIKRCELNEMDKYEQYYIEFYQTLYPNGYNLTIGGKGQFAVAVIKENSIISQKIPYKHTDETKKKISIRLKQSKNTIKGQLQLIKNAQIQHDKKKLEKFKDCKIDHNNIHKYIHPVTSKNNGEIYYYKVYIDKMRADFRGKNQPIAELYNRVLLFLKQLPSI